MILGMSTSTFTAVHVVLSLIGIASGLIVLFGMIGSKRLQGLTTLFSGNHGTDERDRFPVSLREIRPTTCGRHHLAGCASGCAPGALRIPHCRTLAMDLCRERGAGSLSQRLRRGRAGFPEGVVPQGAGADAVRAALPCRTGRSAAGLPGARHRGSESFSPWNRQGGAQDGMSRFPEWRHRLGTERKSSGGLEGLPGEG